MDKFMNLQVSAFVNYKCLFLMVILGFVREVIGWNWILGGFEIVLFIFFVITFIQTQLKTGYYKFFYNWNRERFDEREEEIFNKTLRTSYLFFSRLSITLFFMFSGFFMPTNHISSMVWHDWFRFGVLIAYIYFAETLPGMVMIWKRKALYNDEDLAEN